MWLHSGHWYLATHLFTKGLYKPLLSYFGVAGEAQGSGSIGDAHAAAAAARDGRSPAQCSRIPFGRFAAGRGPRARAGAAGRRARFCTSGEEGRAAAVCARPGEVKQGMAGHSEGVQAAGCLAMFMARTPSVHMHGKTRQLTSSLLACER